MAGAYEAWELCHWHVLGAVSDEAIFNHFGGTLHTHFRERAVRSFPEGDSAWQWEDQFFQPNCCFLT